MNAHTPGPWHIVAQAMDADTERHAKVCNPYAFRRHIATHPDLDDPECRIVADMRDGPDGDARLIATAPDLLAALEACLPWLGKAVFHDLASLPVETSKEDLSSVLSMAGKAIAKARGEAHETLGD